MGAEDIVGDDMEPKLIVAGEFVDGIVIDLRYMANGKIWGHINRADKDKIKLPEGSKYLLLDDKEIRIVGTVENNTFVFSEVWG